MNCLPALFGALLVFGLQAALDGDPFVDGQDWDIESFSASVKDTGPDTAAAVVTMDNMGAKRTVELALKKIQAGWRVDDIGWAEGTLRGIYSGGENQKDEDTLPDTQKLQPDHI